MNPLVVIALLAAGSTGTGYRCVDVHGHTAFQDTPCPRDSEQTRFQYWVHTPPPPDAPLQADSSPTNDGTPPPIAHDEPRTVPPEQYLCERYDGSKRYYSDTGETVPYLAPLGVMGWTSRSLSEAYGNRGRLGVSAPAVSRPSVASSGPSSTIAGSYTWVEDRCQRLSPDAACAALHKQLDTNLRQQRRSFREARAPLQARERTLRTLLAGC